VRLLVYSDKRQASNTQQACVELEKVALHSKTNLEDARKALVAMCRLRISVSDASSSHQDRPPIQQSARRKAPVAA